jgi:hypothetical protein
MCYLETLKFEMNLIGLLSTGAGTLLLAWIVFSFKDINKKGEHVNAETWEFLDLFTDYIGRNSWKNKVSIALILLGWFFQLTALFIGH